MARRQDGYAIRPVALLLLRGGYFGQGQDCSEDLR